MYEPRSGVNIPRFTIPGVKDLEDALNALSDAVQDTAARTKSFESSSTIRAIDTGSSIAFELLDKETEHTPGRFEICYDRYRSRVYVYEGRVSVNLNGVDTVVIPTIDKVKILLPDSPGFKALGIERPASFDVKTKLPPTDDSDTPVFKIYLKVLISAQDEADRFSIILHNYSENGHPSETIAADLYFEIGEIFKTNKKIYINQKWSSDITLPALTTCTFQVNDVTKYPKEKQNPDDPEEEWPSTSEFKISVRNAKILGRYPDGMDEETVYKVSVEEDLMDKDQFYVYAKVMLDEYGIVQDYDKAVTIEISQYWLPSGSCIQRIPIARVSPYNSNSGAGSEKYKLEIENYCPLIEIKQPNNCAFEVEDATDSTTEVKIQVKRTAVDDKYPDGMEDKNLPYQLTLPSDSEWFAVYVVIELDSDGNISSEEKPITIGLYDEYKVNEPLIQYSLVAEVNVSIREDGTRYVSYIKNLCAEVTVNKKLDCPFELYDASEYDDEGVAKNAKVYVTNTPVFDGRYPQGMDGDGRYVLQITQDDVKVGGVLPSVGICYIYLRVLVDEFGEVQDYDTAITIEKTSRWYPDRGCSVQRFLIGSVQVDSSNSGGNPTFLSLASMCPIVSLNRDACCPFLVEDSSEDDKLKVQVRTGKVGGKYPAGMLEKGVYVLELPKEENFHLIYCVSVLTADGYLYPDREDGDDYVSFVIEKDYVTNTENLQYDLIAIVNTNEFEIVSIQNSCYEPVFKKPEPCAFALYDASDYQNNGTEEEPKWEANNCKVLVTQSSIRGEYPEGMSGDPEAAPYILTFNDSDFEQWGESSIERCYVYLLAIVDNKGEISKQEGSLTIEKSPHWYDSDNSLYQRILIGWVDANIDGGPTMYSVHSDCPNLSLRRPADCRFKIEDASDLSPDGEKKVVIRNGKINDRYPEGMDEDTIYEISLPEKTVGEYYVFAVISIDQNGNALSGVDGGPEISFSIEKEYKQNTSTEYYSIIGTIYLNDNGQLTIQSYCLDPSLPDKNLCPFELYDASDYDNNGDATNAKVLVSNYSVFGGRYAEGMDSDSRFVLTITPEDTKVGGVTPSIGTCYIYLEVLVDEYGEVLPYDTAITISKTSAWYQERGCCTQRFMIGSVQVENGSLGSKFLSVSPTCPIIALNRDSCCPFLVENVSEDDKLKVQIRTGTVGGKYPLGMEKFGRYILELPKEENFHLIYCVSVLTADGYLYPDREDGDDYVSFVIEKDYVTNTENLQYDLIAIVNTNEFEIVSIQNSCYEPVFKKPEPCAFALYDASDYQNNGTEEEPKWEANNCKVLVTQSSIRGIYPEGMSADPKAEPYILTFNGSDFEDWGGDGVQRCYVYLLVLVKDNGDILQAENSVTIEKSPYWYDSDSSSYQRILIGWVDATSDATIVAVHSECPNLSLKKPANCLFKIEDATDLTADGEKKVVIRNGKINGRYPEGMDADTIYEIALPEESVGDYYVYAVISIDQNGMALEGDDGGPEISFSIEKDYQQNTSTEVYSIIGTINLNELGQLTIQSYCLDPSVPERNLCPFELYDASDYDNQGKPTNAKVLVSNYSVFGDRYAKGMSAEGSFVLTITPDDTKLGNVTPENGICYVYLEVLVDEYGEVLPADTAITIGKTSAWYQERGCCTQRFLIGSVQVTNTGSTSKFSSVSSLCPIIALNKDACCPFLVEDASDKDGLKVQVRTGTIAGKYPAGMEKRGRYVLELPEGEDFHLIYCVSVLTADGYLYPDREDGDDYVSFAIEKDYVTNTENLQYDLIAIVNTNEFEIVSIQNSCYEPIYKERAGCDFALYDASDYENTGTEEKPKWEATSCKVLVTQSSIRGIYPEGMSGDPKDPDYILTFAAADFTSWPDSDGVQRSYVYLQVLVDDDDNIYTLENSVTIETSPFWSRNDNHTYQRILIGWVEARLSSGGAPKMLSVQSACPDLVLNKKTNCPFKLEDASQLTITGTKEVMITNGKINDRYPSGMSKNTIYTLGVPAPSQGNADKIFYVYAVISIDQYGRALPGQDGGGEISFLIEDEYKYNTADTYYAVIGTVEFDADKQLVITSYCIDPSISSSVESCGFKTTDASTWAAGANAPSRIAVRIQNSKIDGKYPDGMGNDVDYVLELNPNEDFNPEGVCYIYAKAVLNPAGQIPDNAQNKPLTIEKVSKYQPKGNFIQHIPIAHVYIAPVAGGSGKEIVKITNFCPTGQLNEINTCAFFTEDVTDYSDNTRTKLTVLVANRYVHGVLPANMSEQTCFEYEFTIDQDVDVYYVCCRIETDRYGLVNSGGVGQEPDIRISVEKKEPKSTTYYQWFVLATVYVDIENQYIWDIQNYCYVPEAKPRNCFFEVTDACSYNANFKPTGGLKVEVDQWSLPNTETSSKPNGVYPTGMGNDSRYILTLPDDAEWYGIFLNIQVDQENEILTTANAVTLSVETYMPEGTSTYQVFYLAGINIAEDEDGDRYISYIDNKCTYVAVKPPPSCPFLVEDASSGQDCKIQIRSGRIANKYPTNMNGVSTYTLTVPSDQTWWVVYCGMVVSNGEIQTGEGQVTFYLSDKYLTNTESFVNFKIAEIETYLNSDNNRYVGWVDNVCAIPFVAGGASLPCPFKVLDVSDENGLKIAVTWGLIWNMLPTGMYPDDDPQLIMDVTDTCFLYSKIDFDSSLIVTGVSFSLQTSLVTNTASTQYNIIAVIDVKTSSGSDGKKYISKIRNSCVQPFPSPCSLT